MMTTPTIPDLASKGPTVTTAKREKLIKRAMGAIHKQTVDAAKSRVPQISIRPDVARVSERARLLRARKHYSKTHDRFLNRATRRANAKGMQFAG